jgi:hypothetical protein
MRTLRQKDLKALVALLDSFDQVDAGAFPGRVAVGLHTIVPRAVASYNEFGPRSTTVAAVEPDDARSTGDEAAFVRLAWQHPVLARFRAARSQPARAISDYASRQELERLELYHDVYRPLGIADQISIALPGPTRSRSASRWDASDGGSASASGCCSSCCARISPLDEHAPRASCSGARRARRWRRHPLPGSTAPSWS